MIGNTTQTSSKDRWYKLNECLYSPDNERTYIKQEQRDK